MSTPARLLCRPIQRGRPSLRSGLVLVVVSVLGLAMLALGTARPARASMPTVSVNTLRTAWDDAEPGLSPAAVSSSDFGQLFSTPVDGQVYAEPIIANGVLVAATANNKAYGLDPVTGAVKWTRDFGPYWPSSTINCGDITPNIGVTSTPVYDPATNSVFVLGIVNDGPDAMHPHWYLHALDPGTGVDRPGWPLTIQGTPSNDPAHAFNPATAMQRPGLLLLDGVVYAGFASHCDFGPYVGYVVGAKTTAPQLTTMWSTEAGSSFAEAGVWQSGGGLVSDGPGRIILATGNGLAPAPGPGNAPPSNLGESVVRLSVNANGTLTPQSFFSPANNARLNQDDADLGAGAPMAIPPQFGTAAHPHLLVQGGKDGRVFLLDADDLGGAAQGPGGTDAVLSTAGPFKGFWGGPAFWGGDGGYAYITESGGYLRALRYGVDGGGQPTLSPVGTSADAFAYASGSPSVTSDGTTSGSALVWKVWSPAPKQPGAQLRAYDPVPVNGVLRQRWSAPIGTAAKFGRVATDNGRVYVGTFDGHIIGFGHPTTSPLTATPTDFGDVAVGSSGGGTVTVTAAKALTLTGISAPAPFSVTAPTLPRSLAKGQQLSVPVSFTPTTPGPASGTLTFATDAGTAAFDLHGRATADGLAADPPTLDFGEVPTGAGKDLTVNISNTGTTPTTITGVAVPDAPFTTGALPAAGLTLAPGAAVAVSVSYRPSAPGSDGSALTVDSDHGSVTVPVAGSAVSGSPELTVTPNPLSFGSVPIGTTGSASFDIRNTGNVTLTLRKAAPPSGVFTAPSPIGEGQQISPGDVVHQTVIFRPTAAGPVSATYQLTGDDNRGPQNVTLSGTGVVDPIAAKYASYNTRANRLGNTLSAETPVAGGKMQRFQFGNIYWSPSTGAHDVRAPILDEYNRSGGPAGRLGFPTTDKLSTSGNTGSHQDFAKNGTIYYSAATGAHEVQGAIRTAWVRAGAERGRLGYPTRDEFAIPGGRRETFQHGSLTLKKGVVTG
jgi:hypothetical protein